MNFLVLGGGTWGVTLAWLLTGNGHLARVWEFDPQVVAELDRTRRHPRLPHLELPGTLSITGDMAEGLAGAEAIVCAVPAAHVRETCETLASAGYGDRWFVICSKGIEQGTHALLSDVVAETLGSAADGRIGVLSGPSHAEEVSRGVPTAVTATAPDLALAERIRDWFMAPRFRVYTQTDMVGVELAAALKNVIAIACGIGDGLGFGDNSKAALMTRGLSEIVRLGVAMGAKQETFFGLAGIGDLAVTCMSRHSRNRNFGAFMGEGATAAEALDKVGMVVEGYFTVRAAVELARMHEVEMPISEAVAAIVFEGVKPAEAVSALMMREAKSEMES
ncbi:MAG: NAD(P)-dependent glycerol-3-phosphate dehydrogenase [SAR324 cluster bacterium]|nr:NAD(P)-dependent glycerol-3-phosphate dehydrogenase [SAR324 cluster bacterium]